MKPNASFWSGKQVLLTGHTGFKGSWLSLWLNRLGAKVTGVSLPPATEPNLFSLAKVDAVADSHFIDIRDADRLSECIRATAPEIVLHLAAQPLVRASYRQPLATFATNIMGTANLLEALRNTASVKVVVIVTTDKVYRNQEWKYPYRENDQLGGHDPYSASKAASEIVTASYREAFFTAQGTAVATARAGNVIGGGDWSEDRLIPDAVKAWRKREILEIRRPSAVRPWQHVLEPLAGYILLAERLWNQPELAGAYNFGPETSSAASVRDVIERVQKIFKGALVHWQDDNGGPHETGFLALEIAKAKSLLGTVPKWPLQETIVRTIQWYQKQEDGEDARSLCLNDIDDYEAAS